MTIPSNIGKRTRLAFLALALALTSFQFSTIASAHEGGEDISGTIQTLGDKTVSVKNAKGKTVEVKLDASTEYARGKVAAKQTDLKVGDRVVVHAMEMKGVLTAHLVQLTTAAKPVTMKTAPKPSK